MKLVYLAVFWLAGIALGLAFDASPAPVLLLALAAIPLGFFVFLARQSPGPVVLAAALVLGFWRVEAAQQPIAASAFLDQQRATVTGRVVDDPEARSRNVRFTLAVEIVDFGPGPQESFSKVLVYAEPPSSLVSLRQPPFFEYGDRVTAKGLWQRPKPFQGFDYPSFLESKGVSGLFWARKVEAVESGRGGLPDYARGEIFSFRRDLSGSLERNLPAPQSALAQALLLGLRGQLPSDVADDFRDTGTSHLLAISGLHVGVLLFLAAGVVSGTIGRKQPLYFLLPLVAVWIYALTSGLPVSVVRAGIMGTTVLAAVALGRPRRVLPALALAAAVMVGIDPKVLGQVSFQLSFAAVTGIALALPWQPRLVEVLSTNIYGGGGGWWRGWVARLATGAATALLVSVAATFTTWPLVAYHFDRIPWMGIPVTLLALPALPAALVGSLATALTGLLHPAAGQIFGWMAWLPLTYMLKLVSWAPHSTSSGTWLGAPLLVGWYGVLGLALLLRGRPLRIMYRQAANLMGRFSAGAREDSVVTSSSGSVAIPRLWLSLAALAAAAAVMLWWQIFSGPTGMLHVYFFDVGQGDSILIVTPQGRQVLVDGGPCSECAVEAVAAEFAFWDKSLDLVVLTHLDADHSRGLLAVLDRYWVGGVLVGSDNVDAPLRSQWDAALERGGLTPVPVEYGYRIDLEPGSDPRVILEVLNPQREPLRPHLADLNNNAVVLRLIYGDTSFFLASDIESEAETAMSLGGMTLASNVLKVPHHGSKSSTTAFFLGRVDPEMVVISVGSSNSYGHPNSDVLDRLRETVEPANVYRTDQRGSIEIVSDGADIWVKTSDR